ncbi:MAG: Hg(II)-responsive transcriptional regulator [Gammaproteobacteria bacterium]|nr:MAG: Hg(II)-responsive transcriptional regulator [Gammaproteobacteria bacterium]
MNSSGYTIGKLARDAGVNVETIRYYERLGLIRRPLTPVQGYRRYPSDTVARLRFIRRAQRLGFTLKQVAELLELEDGNCARARQIAEEKRSVIDAQIRDLTTMRTTLDKLIRACRRDQTNKGHCAVIDTLAGPQD